ncbi:hypothetical protein GNI_032520 [Gregarina niphandrodes]|uniref:Uncharacterized protein n=1 Tax=Gregarina niphandrodes TaxID=110365 RepID=A0A023BAX1_GRENI|nr:hypothetical protein GNI_032520 [Gregarina niphandrodes]EZG78782.1 hypothetical protein GNI_032520 [Gregarina niphandrodes]|eukprot:XP_011129196.1 hypothetical protein GNI_032520 [Gregarina niphandrodes]
MCDETHALKDSSRPCSSCNVRRLVFSRLELHPQSSIPQELAGLVYVRCPSLRDFDLSSDYDFGVRYCYKQPDLLLLKDERESLIFFTKRGLLYSLDLCTYNLQLIRVLMIEHASSRPSVSERVTSERMLSDKSILERTLETSGLVVGVPETVKYETEAKVKAENANLVASVLAQAQQAARAAKALKETQSSPPAKVSRRQLSVLGFDIPSTDNDTNRQKGPRTLVKGRLSQPKGVSELVKAAEDTALLEDEASLICFICLRQFTTNNELQRHILNSMLHRHLERLGGTQPAGTHP